VDKGFRPDRGLLRAWSNGQFVSGELRMTWDPMQLQGNVG